MRQGVTVWDLTASTSGRSSAHDPLKLRVLRSAQPDLVQLQAARSTATAQRSLRPMTVAQAVQNGKHSAASLQNGHLDTSINPLVAGVKGAKTMALTDLATGMKLKGIDVVALSAGEPDFDTPAAVTEAGIQALRCAAFCSQHRHVTGTLSRTPDLSSLWLQGWPHALHAQRRPAAPAPRNLQEAGAGERPPLRAR